MSHLAARAEPGGPGAPVGGSGGLLPCQRDTFLLHPRCGTAMIPPPERDRMGNSGRLDAGRGTVLEPFLRALDTSLKDHQDGFPFSFQGSSPLSV